MSFNNNSEKKDCQVLIILGNGFDLDLKFPTSYQDFYNSDYFPFSQDNEEKTSLGYYIYKKGIVEKWYDLEDILAEFGKSASALRKEDNERDKNDFNLLIRGLQNYLGKICYSNFDKDSVAVKILKAIDDDLIHPTVYSFNYTDFGLISKCLNLSYSEVRNVHGSLEKDDVVLGVGEYAKLGSCASYLYKTSNKNYNSQGILNAFEDSDCIIIFGLSLSKVDYPYFEDFFRSVASRKYMDERRKYIRIFTYDEKSRMETLDNLREMNRGLIKLQGYSDFDIICTKNNIDEKKVEEVVAYLKNHQWQIYRG